MYEDVNFFENKEIYIWNNFNIISDKYISNKKFWKYYNKK